MPSILVAPWLMVSALTASPGSLDAVPTYGCPAGTLERLDAPRDAELPVNIAQLSCVPFGSSPYPVSDTIISPDGRYAARWHSGSPASIEVTRIDATQVLELPNRVGFRSFYGFGGPDAIAWFSNSQSLLTVRQEVMNPSGRSLGELIPVTIDLSGKMTSLPTLRHAAGSLDGLMWIGGNGLALAQFGTRGGYYQPERDDPMPTLAIVDAAKGTIRASFLASSIPEILPQLKTFGVKVDRATATTLRDGRVRSVMQFRTSIDRVQKLRGETRGKVVSPGVRVVWTEGETPRRVKGVLAREMALTPDGSKLLLVHELQPAGVQISGCHSCPAAPPPTPVTGPIAELIDVESGKLLWRTSVRVDQFWNQRAGPAISPDGRFALVEVPEGMRPVIALLSMTDGRIFQRFSPVGVGGFKQAVTFAPDGRSIWLTSGNLVVRYRLNIK